MKANQRLLTTAASTLLLATTSGVNASEPGLYMGLGVSSNTYNSNENTVYSNLLEDERSTGWRAEIGHIWEIGKPGGTQLGVSGAYNSFGKVSNSGAVDITEGFRRQGEASLEANAFSAYFVLQQVLAPWVDFTFKVGPSIVGYEAEMCCNRFGNDLIDEKKTRFGASAVIGFTFYPTQHFAIELAGQSFAWLDEVTTDDDVNTDSDYYDNDIDFTWLSNRGVTLTAQYRF